jgi:nucleotide-binding universal stress UspA family protein
MTRILVPVDYSEHSRTVAAFAGTLAARLKAELHLLYVWETMPHFPPTLEVTTPRGRCSLDELVRANAQKEMAEFVASCTLPSSVHVETHVDSGLPVRNILHWIESGKFDLVAMGTNGKGGLKHAVLGSVARRVMQLSPVPVITVGARCAATEPAVSAEDARLT